MINIVLYVVVWIIIVINVRFYIKYKFSLMMLYIILSLGYLILFIKPNFMLLLLFGMINIMIAVVTLLYNKKNNEEKEYIITYYIMLLNALVYIFIMIIVIIIHYIKHFTHLKTRKRYVELEV